LGTVADVVMHGVKVRMPVPLGMPTLSGAISTAGGLVFFSGTQDYYLRAFDIANGKEVWKGRLPVGAQATPMTYLSPASGRQFVVTTAGGARQSPDRGDYVVAYALPKGHAAAPLPKDTEEEKSGASSGGTPAERTEPPSPEQRY
jgi:quinate dehydrogenase (quinone)